MGQLAHSEGSAKPVAIAIVLTLAVCGLCMAAYLKFVVEPKMQALSNNAQSSCSEAAALANEAPTAQQPRPGRRDASRAAAFIRGLSNMRDEVQASSESHPQTDENARPSDEEIRTNRLMEMATLEKEFEREPVDPDWANDIEDELKDAVADFGRNLELNEVTCHTTFCRARLTHANPNTRIADIDQLMITPALSAQTTTFVPPDNENETVMYFSREGHALSTLAPRMPGIPRIPLAPDLADSIELPPSVRWE